MTEKGKKNQGYMSPRQAKIFSYGIKENGAVGIPREIEKKIYSK